MFKTNLWFLEMLTDSNYLYMNAWRTSLLHLIFWSFPVVSSFQTIWMKVLVLLQLQLNTLLFATLTQPFVIPASLFSSQFLRCLLAWWRPGQWAPVVNDRAQINYDGTRQPFTVIVYTNRARCFTLNHNHRKRYP